MSTWGRAGTRAGMALHVSQGGEDDDSAPAVAVPPSDVSSEPRSIYNPPVASDGESLYEPPLPEDVWEDDLERSPSYAASLGSAGDLVEGRQAQWDLSDVPFRPPL